jgi:capsular exopolysaccharide synthesis family protein
MSIMSSVNIRPSRKAVNIETEREHILGDASPFSTIEEYKMLRASVAFAVTVDGCKLVGVTSAMPNEGKSITALNLAIAIAMTEARVLLIDCDMRKGKLSRLLSIPSAPGVSNMLANMCSPGEAVQNVMCGSTALDVMPSGDIPPNPSELLASDKMDACLERLAEDYDYILADMPPVNLVSDASVLSKKLSGIIMVTMAEQTKRQDLSHALDRLGLVGVNVLGFVLNKVPGAGFGRYTKYGAASYYAKKHV